jgi:hypothetical protein
MVDQVWYYLKSDFEVKKCFQKKRCEMCGVRVSYPEFPSVLRLSGQKTSTIKVRQVVGTVYKRGNVVLRKNAYGNQKMKGWTT